MDEFPDLTTLEAVQGDSNLIDLSTAVPIREDVAQRARGALNKVIAGELDLTREQIQQLVTSAREGKGPWQRAGEWTSRLLDPLINPVTGAKMAYEGAKNIFKTATGVLPEFIPTGDSPTAEEGATPELAKQLKSEQVQREQETQNLPLRTAAGAARGLAGIATVAAGAFAEGSELLGLDSPENAAGLYQFQHDMNRFITKKSGVSKEDPASQLGELGAFAALPLGAEAKLAPTIAKAADVAVEAAPKVIGKTISGTAKAGQVAGPAIAAGELTATGHPIMALGTLLAGYTPARYGWIGSIKHAIIDQGLGAVKTFGQAMADKPYGVPILKGVQNDLEVEAAKLEAKLADMRASAGEVKLSRVDKLGPDGTPLYDLEELSPAEKEIRLNQDRLKNAREGIDKIEPYAQANRVLTDAAKYGLQTVGNLGVAETAGAAFTSAGAPPGDVEAQRAGQEMGLAFGLPGLHRANVSGRLEMLRNEMIGKGKKLISEDQLVGLTPEQQDSIYAHAAEVAPLGGKIEILSPDDIIKQASGAMPPEEGAVAPNGMFDPDTNTIYINRDAVASGVIGHEFTHLADEQLNLTREKFSKDIQGRIDSGSEAYKEFAKNYEERIRVSDPSYPDLTPAQINEEVKAEIGRLIKLHMPPETFYGGKGGATIIKDWVGKLFNKDNGQIIGTIDGFGAPYTRGDINALKDVFYGIGEKARSGEKVSPSVTTAEPQEKRATEPSSASTVPSSIASDATSALKGLGISDPGPKVEAAIQELGPDATLEDVVRKATQRAVPKDLSDVSLMPNPQDISNKFENQVKNKDFKINRYEVEFYIKGIGHRVKDVVAASSPEEARAKAYDNLDSKDRHFFSPSDATVEHFETVDAAKYIQRSNARLEGVYGEGAVREYTAQSDNRILPWGVPRAGVLSGRSSLRNLAFGESAIDSAPFMPATKSDTIDRPASKISDLIFPGTPRQAKVAAKKYGLSDVEIESTHQPGFVTQGGAFLSPEEARLHGEERGQLPESTKDKLTPEDLASDRLFMPAPSDHPDALKAPAMKRKSDGRVFSAKNAATPHWQMAMNNPELKDRYTLGGVDRYEDGWVTNDGEFLDKKQGHARAIEQKQIAPDFKTEYKGALSTLDLREGGQFMPSVDRAQQSAEDYVNKSGIGKILPPSSARVDVDRARQIAKDYEALPKSDDSPETRESYEQFVHEVDAQYQHALDSGMKFEFTKDDPYKNSAEMMADVEQGKLKVYTGGSDHPYLGESTKDENGLTANDKFRAIHDLYGHASIGAQFGPQGEERAWRKHAAMFSDVARPAMTTETRGQNSWVNYGPHMFDENGYKGDKSHPNYIPSQERPFAEQKASLLPQEHSELPEGTVDARGSSVARSDLSGVTIEPKTTKLDSEPFRGKTIEVGEEPWSIRLKELTDKEWNGTKLTHLEEKELVDLHKEAAKNYGSYQNWFEKMGGEKDYLGRVFGEGEQKDVQFMPAPHIEREAERLGLKYTGQMGSPDKAILLYNDPITKSTIAVKQDAERGELQKKLQATRDRFINSLDFMPAMHEGFYSPLEKHLEDKMPNKVGPEQLSGILAKSPVKKAELEWTGINDLINQAKKAGRRITKEEALDYVRANTPEIKEIPKLYGSGSRLNETKYSQHVLPGGENYRELLMTLPNNEDSRVFYRQSEGGQGFEIVNRDGNILESDIKSPMDALKKVAALNKSNDVDQPVFKLSHFDEPNIVGHLRVNDRILPDGSKLLLAEEIQSDWAQKGRKEGYYSPEEAQRTKERNQELMAQNEVTVPRGGTVPDMPFKGEAWKKLMLRNLIRHAVEEGYSSVGWTTGEQQAERYNLSKRVREITVGVKDGTAILTGRTPDDAPFNFPDTPLDKLDDVVGKDLADKIRSDAAANNGKLVKDYKGPDLKVGGEGMKGFYDKELVNLANDIGKKFGTKVGPTTLNIAGDKYKVVEYAGGHYLIDTSKTSTDAHFNPDEDSYQAMSYQKSAMDKEAARLNAKDSGDVIVHSIKITPEMRESVQTHGQPMFMPVVSDPWSKIHEHLTEEERASIRDRDKQKIISIFNKLPSIKKGTETALAGQEARHWYRNSAEAISNTFGPDADRFAALLAALSPQVSVETNLQNAVSVWNAWLKAGKPTDKSSIENLVSSSVIQGKAAQEKGESSALGAWMNNSIRALSHDDPVTMKLSGPKVDSFIRNLRNETQEVTNDRWMGRYGTGDIRMFRQPRVREGLQTKGFTYLAMNAHIRKIAKALEKQTGDNWSPSDVQAAIWSWVKSRADNVPVADVPEFSKLLRDIKPLDNLEEPENPF